MVAWGGTIGVDNISRAPWKPIKLMSWWARTWGVALPSLCHHGPAANLNKYQLITIGTGLRPATLNTVAAGMSVDMKPLSSFRPPTRDFKPPTLALWLLITSTKISNFPFYLHWHWKVGESECWAGHQASVKPICNAVLVTLSSVSVLDIAGQDRCYWK